MGLFHLIDKTTNLVVYADKEEDGTEEVVAEKYPEYDIVASSTGQPDAPTIYVGYLYHDGYFWAPQKKSVQVTTGEITVDKDEFLRLFSFEELVEVYNFQDSDTLSAEAKRLINAFLRYLDGTTKITLTHPTVLTGLDFFVANGYLTEARKSEILTVTFKQ